MKSLFPFLLLVFIISTSCEEGSFSWESNPPEVRLVILNESDLLDKAIGDSIEIEIGLEFYNMQDLFSVDFEVHFGSFWIPFGSLAPPIWIPGPPILGAKIALGAALVVFWPPDAPNTPSDPMFG